MELVEYLASQSVVEITNDETRDGLVISGLQRFHERKVELKEDNMYCCRMLVGDGLQLVVFIMFLENGGPKIHLLTWKECEERGLDKYLLSLIGGSDNYQAGAGRLLYPDKVPME